MTILDRGWVVLWDSLCSFFHSLLYSNTQFFYHLHASSLSLSHCLQPYVLLPFLTPLFPSSLSRPASGHLLTAMMTSFSGLKGVSLLACLNGPLSWPRYSSWSSPCPASEAVFNIRIRLCTSSWLKRHFQSILFLCASGPSHVSISPIPDFPGVCLACVV